MRTHVIELIESELQKEGYTLLERGGTYGSAALQVAKTIMSARREMPKESAE